MTLRKYLPYLRAIVSIVALVLLLILFDFSRIAHIIVTIRGAAFAAAVAAFVLTTILFIVKWNLTLPSSIGFLRAARGYVASYFYSLLPTGQAGAELGKVMTLANHAELSLLAGSVIFDKLVGLLALGILGTAAWCLVPGASRWMAALTLVIVAGCGLALACAPFASRLSPHSRSAVPAAITRVRIKLLSLSGPVGRWVRNPALLIKVLVLGLVGQACMIAVYVIIARALGIDLALPHLALFVVVANLATLVPVSLGGVGVREASLTGLLAAQGTTVESAIALSLMVFAVFLLGAALGAVVEFHELVRAWKSFATRRHARMERAAEHDDP